MYSNELYHHGVKGMKWGVRRYQNEDGTLTEAGKRRMNPEKAVKKMSDAELEAITKRLTLESTYKELRYKENRRGKEAAEKALKVVGVIGLTAVAVAGVTVGKEALKKFGTDLGSKMADTMHEHITSSLKSASENTAKAASNAVKSSADKLGKAASNAVKNVISNPISETRRNEIINRATDIGKNAAEKAIRSGKITREQAPAYANQIRQKVFEQLLKQATG